MFADQNPQVNPDAPTADACRPSRTYKSDVESASPSAPEKPHIVVNLDGIPAFMKSIPKWIFWQPELRWQKENRKWTKPKWTKPPVRVSNRTIKTNYGEYGPYLLVEHVDHLDPASQWPYQELAAVVGLCQSQWGRTLWGLGFVVDRQDGLVMIDLDDCRDPTTGEVDAWALKIVYELGSFTEISTSGTGLKVFVRAQKPGNLCRTKLPGGGEIEIYDHARFNAMTGDRFEPDTLPAEPMERQAELDAVYTEVFRDRLAQKEGARQSPAERVSRPAMGGPGRMDDAAVIERIRASRSEAKFSRLFEQGDTSDCGGDASAADYALACMLLFWCQLDTGQVERIMRLSALIRPKWSEARGGDTWLGYTIKRALKRHVGGYYGDGNWNSGRSSQWQAERDAELEAIGPADPADVERLFGQSARTVSPVSSPRQPSSVDIGSLALPPSVDELSEKEELRKKKDKEAARLAVASHPPLRTCGYKRSMYHPIKGIYRACHVSCGRWKCETCGPKKKEQWRQHLREKITTVRVLGGLPGQRRPRSDPVYLVNVRDDPKTTERIVKHLKRHNGDFARIKYSPGRQVFVATVPFQDKDAAECMSPIDAAAEIDRLIDGMVLHGNFKKPIFTSRGWKLPPRKPAGWKVVGDFAPGISKTEIVEAMEAEVAGQCEIRVKRPNLPFMTWVADCLLPYPPPDDPLEEMTRIDQARAFHSRLVYRILGISVDKDQADVPDWLFGVPAGP